MSDLKERLLNYRAYCPNTDRDDHPICGEALARIEQLEAALRDAERCLEWGEPQPKPVLERVRQALGDTQ